MQIGKHYDVQIKTFDTYLEMVVVLYVIISRHMHTQCSLFSQPETDKAGHYDVEMKQWI